MTSRLPPFSKEKVGGIASCLLVSFWILGSPICHSFNSQTLWRNICSTNSESDSRPSTESRLVKVLWGGYFFPPASSFCNWLKPKWARWNDQIFSHMLASTWVRLGGKRSCQLYQMNIIIIWNAINSPTANESLKDSNRVNYTSHLPAANCPWTRFLACETSIQSVYLDSEGVSGYFHTVALRGLSPFFQ